MNRVFINDSCIEQVYIGRQTFQTVMETAAELMVLADDLRKRKRKIRILVNINKITNVTADSLLVASDAINSVPEAKIAIYGGGSFLHKLAELVISATGRQKTVRLFRTRLQAERWLKR